MARPAILKYLIDKSKSEKIPGFRDISPYDTLRRIKKEVVWDDMIERASAISFNSAMALPPLLLFLCSLIPVIVRFNFVVELDLIGQLNDFVKDVVPARNNFQPILDFINSIIERPRNTLLIVSILLSIFFSSNAMMGIMRSFDTNYPGFKKRKGIKKRLIAIKITMILVLLFILCLALLIAQKSVLTWLGIENQLITEIWVNLRWVLIFLLVFTIISYIYRHAPSVDKKWKLITPGSVLATCLVVISSLAFSWWVGQFGTYNKLYGSIGTIIFVMVLIFFNALILLMGFELNANIYALSKTKNEKDKHQIPNTSKLK
ncbi:MAG TPA: YihY/virulence factor BrkB family protein [Niabella sp.]|nr:YihY/virulence factor BrkB family protein [Niabella sp.]HQW14990.1 YihY/virulence factor BrkB family protein [Niabella sp.]HQX20118.1 YihY/virulence factor BrkB family protein [Niabella sp.]HQX40370.1 YihY/virulence factor BrkB family protein [Niabella sp.]HRB06723.1 YihY/virulence factor BrkB family protein [Niabella sp.]